MNQWVKTPEVNGFYWYKDIHSENMNLPIVIIAKVIVVDESSTIVAIHGELFELSALYVECPWFLGPLEQPDIPCSGSDGYNDIT